MNYYDLLGVPADATPDQIRSAYRTLVQLFHPDRLSHLKPESRAFAEDRLRAINRAYEVLGDPARRAGYDVANAPRGPAPAPPPPPASSWPPASSSPPRPVDLKPDLPGAARRATMDRRRRIAQLEAEITDLTRGVAQMEADRDRTSHRWRRLESRTRWWFWFFTVFTGLGALNLLAIGLGLFSLPPGQIDPWAQRVGYVLLVALYEYAATLTITFVCRIPGTRVSFWQALLPTGRGLVAGWGVGLLGWAAWSVIFSSVDSLASVGVLALVLLLGHVAFVFFALGHLPRQAREQQQLFEHVSKPMLEAYQNQLIQLRAQKAAMETETS